MKLTIILPLPARDLSPNRSRNVHWRRKAQAVKKARFDAYVICVSAMVESGLSNVRIRGPEWKAATVRCRWYFATNRRRDRDNLLGWCKAYFDGLTDARLIADDSGLTHLPPVVEIDATNPRLEIDVEETT